MYCSECGTNNPVGYGCCRICGAMLSGGYETVGSWSGGQTSGLAIASFVMGLASFAMLVTAVPGIVCGFIALSRIKKSGGILQGRGFAIAGIVTSFLSLLMIAGFFVLFIAMALGMTLWAVNVGPELMEAPMCMFQLQRIASLSFVHSMDGSEAKLSLPDEKWCDYMLRIAEDVTVLQCPGSSHPGQEGVSDFALNANYKNVVPGEESVTILFFESRPGWNQVGGKELLNFDNHGGLLCGVVFVDGHVDLVDKDKMKDLKW